MNSSLSDQQRLTGRRISRKDQGIKVSVGLISNVKYTKKNRRATRPAARSLARKLLGNGQVTVEQLIEVKKLTDSLGGAEQVRSALVFTT